MVLRYEIHEWGSTARTRRRSRAVIMELNVRIFAGGGGSIRDLVQKLRVPLKKASLNKIHHESHSLIIHSTKPRFCNRVKFGVSNNVTNVSKNRALSLNPLHTRMQSGLETTGKRKRKTHLLLPTIGLVVSKICSRQIYVRKET